MGSTEEPQEHELRKDEPCFAILLREEDSRTCPWTAFDLQIRSGYDERMQLQLYEEGRLKKKFETFLYK